jgi:hypothetical protein
MFRCFVGKKKKYNFYNELWDNIFPELVNEIFPLTCEEKIDFLKECFFVYGEELKSTSVPEEISNDVNEDVNTLSKDVSSVLNGIFIYTGKDKEKRESFNAMKTFILARDSIFKEELKAGYFGRENLPSHGVKEKIQERLLQKKITTDSIKEVEEGCYDEEYFKNRDLSKLKILVRKLYNKDGSLK